MMVKLILTYQFPAILASPIGRLRWCRVGWSWAWMVLRNLVSDDEQLRPQSSLATNYKSFNFIFNCNFMQSNNNERADDYGALTTVYASCKLT